jgi:hypothetical protein
MRCVSENHHSPLPPNTLCQHLYIFSSGGDIEVKWWGKIPRPSGGDIEVKWWGKLSRSSGGDIEVNWWGKLSRSSGGDI